MSTSDYYAAERERAATEQALRIERERREALSAVERDRVDQIANAELRQIGIRAHAQLTAAGIGPARIFRDSDGFFTGNRAVRRAWGLGAYWTIGWWGYTAVMVNESGIFGGYQGRTQAGRNPGEIDVVLTHPLSPLTVNRNLEPQYSSDHSPMSVGRDEHGLPMIGGRPVESMVARDVIDRIAARRS